MDDTSFKIMKFFTILGEVLGGISCVYDLWAQLRGSQARRFATPRRPRPRRQPSALQAHVADRLWPRRCSRRTPWWAWARRRRRRARARPRPCGGRRSTAAAALVVACAGAVLATAVFAVHAVVGVGAAAAVPSPATAVRWAAERVSERSKVLVTSKLWYLRISALEAQDVFVPPGAGGIAVKGRHADVFAKVQVGGMALRTRPCAARSPTGLVCNQELVFAVAEPFDEPAVLIIEARVHPGKEEMIGRAVLPLTLFEKRLDRRQVHAQWFSLEPFGRPARLPEAVFAGRVQLRACLEGAYHVMEPTMYGSDTRPTARQLWRPPIAVLEVGGLGAQGLTPMKTVDGRCVTDAYCVAKYGHKWVMLADPSRATPLDCSWRRGTRTATGRWTATSS
ncbi:hypothetical protein C2845_PM09G11990 [Panicum miliaceum]|uniref:C2 domain-containing protein n=1 Tax=Panicum miliaceum TaxID=4540 RepID=A0A3L6RY89_PANMI|nr:hypothetical protein C2845_PM09G11990 [Panicum miliaceum]